jgi:hypothetical protein
MSGNPIVIEARSRIPLKKFFAKVTDSEKEEIFNYINWRDFRGGFLRLYKDRLVFKGWQILYDEIDSAVIHNVVYLYIPCYVLVINSNGNTYKIAMNPNRFWKNQVLFPVEIKDLKIKCSRGKKIINFISLASILYTIYKTIEKSLT